MEVPPSAATREPATGEQERFEPSERAERILEDMREVEAAAREQIDRIDRNIREFATKQPLVAVGVALAAGFVLGRALRR